MSEEKKLVLPAYLDGFHSLKDNSIKLIFTTQEVNEEAGRSIFDFRGQFGNLIFVSQETKEVKIPPLPEPGEVDAQKSPAQRLRAVMFVYWQQRLEGSDQDRGFNQFYEKQIERLIEQWKEKLT